jgi:cytochrome b pre-mRNA-processing protein 3
MRKNVGGFTETYVAYSQTDILYKKCATQAIYDIPQAWEKNGVIPKTATGEDIGEGTGWWYEGEAFLLQR